jgi:hypothetical protein
MSNGAKRLSAQDDSRLLETATARAIETHLKAYGINTELVRRTETFEVIWNFSADNHLSCVVRLYQHESGFDFLQIEVAFGLVDNGADFPEVAKTMAFENGCVPGPVRIAVSDYEGSWLCLTQSWCQCNYINPQSVEAIITWVIDIAGNTKTKLLTLPGFQSLPERWFFRQTTH